MATSTQHGWRVISERAWVFEYAFAKHGTANCVALRLANGGVVVLSPAQGMSEGAYSDLARLGPVTALVATNGHHHLGIGAFRKRFPDARVYAPTLARARIAKKNHEAGELNPLSELLPQLGEDVVIREAPHTRSGEIWAFFKCDVGYVWFVSDILVNIEPLPQALIPRLIFKLSGSGPGYRVFHAALALMIKDKKAMLRALLADAEAHPPAVVVPAHGAPVGDGAPGSRVAAASGTPPAQVAERTLSLLRGALT
jgi:glyoxylase-like metal-dependent hydrolase (beta-lactamase superfamily II)